MTQLIESVLGGGGEMGERMHAFDWSKTALGPLEQWPQSLRICVQIILGSGFPLHEREDDGHDRVPAAGVDQCSRCMNSKTVKGRSTCDLHTHELGHYLCT